MIREVNGIEEIEILTRNISVEEISDENLDKPNFLKLSKRTFKVNYNNATKTVIREEIKVNDACVIVGLTCDKRILLLCQVRPQTKEKMLIELPAGYINENEEPAECAIRELKEETGYECSETSEIKHISTYIQDQGKSSSHNHSFYINDLVYNGEQQLDFDESIPYIILCPVKVAYELLEKGMIVDANSRLALLEMKNVLL